MTEPQGIYTIVRKIRFGDSDPAGIVYYPQFFWMFNDLFEDWYENALGLDFAEQLLHRQRMFPLLHADVDFKEPRVMGQKLELSFILTGLGRSSMRYTIVGRDGDLEIVRANLVTCIASKETKKSIDIPPEIRSPMEAYLEVCRGASPPPA